MKLAISLIMLSCCLYSANSANLPAKAANRLMKELQMTYNSAAYKRGDFSVELAGESVDDWNVELRAVDPKSQLYTDLQTLKQKKGRDSILFNIKFGAGYPFQPPFVRIVYPVVSGGGVHGGGAICMELLSSDGWSSAYTVETLLTAIAAHIVQGNARISFGAKDLGPAEAKRHYDRFFRDHQQSGWGGKGES